MEVILKITGILGAISTFLVLYQFVYIIIGFFKTKKYPDAKQDHEYGVLIAARNEAGVIAQLIESIRNCDYDQSKVRIFVIADNCTDNTAEIARNAGATVFERFNKELIGKGYAMDYLLKAIHEAEPDYLPEGWLVFDADNLLHKDYIKEMNKAFDAGEEIITSLRNGKNFNTNWISSVGCLAFMHGCRFSHAPRSVLGISTNITGTGWLVKTNIINYETGFPWHLLTEDLEFTLDQITKGKKVAYQDSAVFYDEQPTKMKVCYKQRLRWQSGKYQCMFKYTGKLLKKLFTTGKMVYYDQLVSLLPLELLGFLLLTINATFPIVNGIIMLCTGAAVWATLWYILKSLLIVFAGASVLMFIYGVLEVIKDWKRMAASTKSKVLAMFTYPLFMIGIMPIAFIACFKKAKWVHIPHTDSRNISELNKLLEDSNAGNVETNKEETTVVNGQDVSNDDLKENKKQENVENKNSKDEIKKDVNTKKKR